MNYYDRIQKAIDYIEERLDGKIDTDAIAKEAYMSLSNLYRLFFAIVGFPVKEYVRLRRISEATKEIRNSKITVLDLAVKYGFESSEAFSRAFKRTTGASPSNFRLNQRLLFQFERMSILDKCFEVQDQNLLEKYPDIKVLKKLEPMRVAYYNYFGLNPEGNAFKVMCEWLNECGLDIEEDGLRIFGYDDPSPSSLQQTEYGYEVCVTIGEDYIVEDKNIKTKVLEGGLYAVTGVKRGENGDVGSEIMKAWGRFRNWLQESKYIYGGQQWLEEHLGFDEEFRHIGGVDLYMPIIKGKKVDTIKNFVDISPI